MKKRTPIVDAHVHIFPPAMISNREMLLQRDSWFGEAFGHPNARMRTAEELIASMDRAGVDLSIVVGWPWQDAPELRQHNDYLAEACQRFPERLRWLGIINPGTPGAPEEIARCVALGASGFGEINADGQGFRWSEPGSYQESLQAVAASGLPLMVHTSEPVGHRYPGKGFAHPGEIMIAIEGFPTIPWVLAHWGGGLPFYELMPEVKIACTNVAYDSAATSFLYDQSIFQRVIDLTGVQKALFGSDWPVLAQGKLIARIQALGLDDADLEAVLGGNAIRIYGIT